MVERRLSSKRVDPIRGDRDVSSWVREKKFTRKGGGRETIPPTLGQGKTGRKKARFLEVKHLEAKVYKVREAPCFHLDSGLPLRNRARTRKRKLLFKHLCGEIILNLLTVQILARGGRESQRPEELYIRPSPTWGINVGAVSVERKGWVEGKSLFD